MLWNNCGEMVAEVWLACRSASENLGKVYTVLLHGRGVERICGWDYNSQLIVHTVIWDSFQKPPEKNKDVVYLNEQIAATKTTMLPWCARKSWVLACLNHKRQYSPSFQIKETFIIKSSIINHSSFTKNLLLPFCTGLGCILVDMGLSFILESNFVPMKVESDDSITERD